MIWQESEINIDSC